MKERQERHIEASDIEDSSERKKSLIEILLNLSDPVTGFLSKDDLEDEVNTFLFARKISRELDEVLGNSDRWPDNDNLAQLRYLDCVYKESLRLYPPLSFINRQITEDVVIGGYLIPAGVDLALDIHQLHRSPQHFSNPNKFDPGNFDLENVEKRHPYAFVPFSAGPRNCIGQKYAMIEAKIILVQILRNFEIESLHGMEENAPIRDIILVPENGVKIKIRRRIKN